MTTHLEPATPVAPRPADGPAAPTAAHPRPEPVGGQRLLLTALLGVPVIALCTLPAGQFRHWQWIALALAAPVVLWGAWPVHRAAVRLARRGAAGADTLVSLGTLVAFGWSLYALLAGPAGEPGLAQQFRFTAGGGPRLYLDVAAGLTVFVLAGRAAEARASRRAEAALRGLEELAAAEVTVLRDGVPIRIPTGRLGAGEKFVVRPGDTAAGDGVIVEGSSAVDTSLLSGVARPVEVRPGEPITAGWVNVGGRLVVRATRPGRDTQLSRMARVVADTRRGRAAAQQLADRAAGALVPIVLAMAIGTLGFWLGTGAAPEFAVAGALTVLIVACPAAFALALGTALPSAIGRAAHLGILVTGPEVLDAACRVDTVILDRTGTVTSGVMAVQGVHPADGVDAELALRLAGATEQESAHPIGRAITASARAADGHDLPGVAEFDGLPGLGVRGVIAEVSGQSVVAHAVLVGRPLLLAEHGIELPEDLLAARATAESAGHTAIAVAWDGVARAIIAVGDTVKPSSAAAVRGLRELGLTPVLLTGDDGTAARVVADQVGIDPDSVIAEVRPETMVEVVRRLQGEGRVVAMVGDGIADAAALAAADLGLELGPNTGAGELSVLRGELPAVVDALRLARRVRAVTRANLCWGLSYHLAALPVAAFGLVSPVIAGAAMALGSLVVVHNGLRLRRFSAEAVT